MPKFQSLDELLEVAEDSYLATLAYNLGLQAAHDACKAQAAELYKCSPRLQHHTGAVTGSDLCADKIKQLLIPV